MIKLETVPTPEAVREAIRFKSSHGYGAMSMMNALGGSPSEAWRLCHEFPLKELIDHAKECGIPLDGLVTTGLYDCDVFPVEQSLYYKRAVGEISEDEFQKLFKQWQKG